MRLWLWLFLLILSWLTSEAFLGQGEAIDASQLTTPKITDTTTEPTKPSPTPPPTTSKPTPTTTEKTTTKLTTEKPTTTTTKETSLATTTSSSTTTTEENDFPDVPDEPAVEEGLTRVQILFIAIGIPFSVVLVVILIVLIYCILKDRSKKKKQQQVLPTTQQSTVKTNKSVPSPVSHQQKPKKPKRKSSLVQPKSSTNREVMKESDADMPGYVTISNIPESSGIRSCEPTTAKIPQPPVPESKPPKSDTTKTTETKTKTEKNDLAGDWIPPHKVIYKGPLIIHKYQKLDLEHELDNQSERPVLPHEHVTWDDTMEVHEMGSEVEVVISNRSKLSQKEEKQDDKPTSEGESKSQKSSLKIPDAPN